MFRNYSIIALRLLVKNKVFSLINILGLSTGIACCILITLHIQDELSYEHGFTDYERVFRINTAFSRDGIVENGAFTSPPIARDLAAELPEIETYTRVMAPLNTEVNIVRYEDKTFFEKRAFLVDSTFLDVFPYQLAQGDAATALDGPSAVLLSEKLSSKIFGDKNPIDELLIINSGPSADTFRITGVVATPEFPSHIDADIYMNMNSKGWGKWVLSQTTWANNNMVGSYLKLRNPNSYKVTEAKFPAFVERKAGAELRQSGRGKSLSLQSLDNIRLYSDIKASQQWGAGITYVYVVGIIGIIILLLACINFMNLTTAKSAQRAGEVGIRKSMGAFRKHLISQFLGESMVIVTIALVVAFGLVLILLPSFNTIMQKELAFNGQNVPFIVGAAVLIALVTGILAGGYPAFFLSSLKPARVLKGNALGSDGSQWLRKGLVVFQFVITITLISSIVIIQQQIGYIQSKSLGFDKDQVIMIPMRTSLATKQYTTLKESFEQLSGVTGISATSSIPSTPLQRDWLVYKQGATSDQTTPHDIVTVDAGYFDVMKIQLITGRDFIVGQDNVPTDTISPTRIVVNESSLKAFDIPLEQAVGSTIYFQPGDERFELNIVGVVKDFHQFSLHREIRPMMFMLAGNRNSFPYMAVSINMNSYAAITEAMKTVWDQRIESTPFESIVLGENLKTMYQAEQRTSSLLTISTVIALLISCLGLYGLSVYVAERRTREIGIRKVVGASLQSIVGMLSTEYVKLIGIAFVISIPIGYYFMQKWLEGFAYKIEPGILVFLGSGLMAFTIAWLTISFESFRAARRNPVETLRNK